MKIWSYLLPVFIAFVFAFAFFKKVKLYDSFESGAKNALSLVGSLFSFLLAIFVMTELFEKSGLSKLLIDFLSPFFGFFGIPPEICKLCLLKPFSGSGSLALLSEIYTNYGADSYVARCGSVVFGSSETVFYIAAIYFSECKNKKLLFPIIVSLIASFAAAIFAAFICKIL